jgi:beta-fructofuranosidase
VATPHADFEGYSGPGHLEQPGAGVFEAVLDGGADLRCAVTAGTVISVATPAGPLATLRHDGDGIEVTADGNPDFDNVFFPADEGTGLRVIIDAGVLEISGSQGIMAVPLPIVDVPVTLTVTGAVGTPVLRTVENPAGTGAVAGRFLLRRS